MQICRIGRQWKRDMLANSRSNVYVYGIGVLVGMDVLFWAHCSLLFCFYFSLSLLYHFLSFQFRSAFKLVFHILVSIFPLRPHHCFLLIRPIVFLLVDPAAFSSRFYPSHCRLLASSVCTVWLTADIFPPFFSGLCGW